MAEIIKLNNPKIIIGEWIPFGENHIAALNRKLGAFKRVKNALFTTKVTRTPQETITKVNNKTLTEIFVKEFDSTEFVSFNAGINNEEDEEDEEDVIQEKNFGVYAHASGFVVYSMELFSVKNKEESKISLDNISSILADISVDSSIMMQTLLTPYQQSLLDLVFFEKSEQRDKYHFIIADSLLISTDNTNYEEIQNNLGKNELENLLMDGEDCENELRQVVDEIQGICKFSDNSYMIIGIHGAIYITQNSKKIEASISIWLFLMATDIFVKDLFTRLFIINDDVVEIQELIAKTELDPTSVEIAQNKLVKSSSEGALIDEIVSTLKTAINDQDEYLNCKYEILNKMKIEELNDIQKCNTNFINKMELLNKFKSMKSRIIDMNHIVHCTQQTLGGLRDNINATNERRTHQVQRELQENTRNLEDITRTNERTGSSLQILELILAGALSFEIVSMIIGEWTAENVLDSMGFMKTLTIPGVLLAITIIGWLGISIYLVRRVKFAEKVAREYLTTRITFNKRCNVEKLRECISDKKNKGEIIDLDGDVLPNSERIRVSWISKECKWRKNLKPTILEKFLRKVKETEITIWFDDKNHFLLSALVEIPAPPKNLSISDVQKMLNDELLSLEIIS